ncbi:Mitotic spindle checkpoint protein BUBR1 [Linum perenne]
MAASAAAEDLFSSVVSDIKSYPGKDPLLPWLRYTSSSPILPVLSLSLSFIFNIFLLRICRGIKKMTELLPPNLLKAKLPRFLQKCAQTFESDKRYKNDPRYLRVWLQLMDYVDEPRVLLRTMEKNDIGMKRSLFYQAYALYYEKIKKFEDAEKMYHLGVHNLAEPVDDLRRSYEQFLHRMQRHMNKKTLTLRTDKRPLSVVKIEENNENVCGFEDVRKQIPGGSSRNVKCVDKKPELVDPVVKTKEAVGRCAASTLRENHSSNDGFEIFVDENMERLSKPLDKGEEKAIPKTQQIKSQASQPRQEPLQVFIDDEESEENEKDSIDQNEALVGAFVFPSPKDVSSEEGCDGIDGHRSPRNKLREDTVVHRFVGSTILDEPAVENACHHGLVDPTVNLKEAMEDINNMFGKPIEFVRARRGKQQGKASTRKQALGRFSILPDNDLDHRQSQATKEQEVGAFSILPDEEFDHQESHPAKIQELGGFLILPDDDADDHKQSQHGKKQELGGFSILPDDDLDQKQSSKSPHSSSNTRGSDLFEPTVFTKEAMDDINKLFGMPLDL